MTDNHESLNEAELDAIVKIHSRACADPCKYGANSLSNVPRLLAAVNRLRAENAKLAAGWASVDTTKLADITDLDECKRRLQRERERSHGAIRELNERANTPNPELAKLRAAVEVGLKVCNWLDAEFERGTFPLATEFRDALAALKGGDDAS